MNYKYYAFISYNHRDAKIAEWLHKKLEAYRIPSECHNEIEANQKFLRPIFRDKDELNAGILVNELREKLEASKYLIVICSRNSANSEWVSNEVKAFIEMGRLDRIIPVMVEDSTDVYPRALCEYTASHPEDELLGVSIPEVGREKAFVRVVSKMLDLSFDSLWNRHKRLRRNKSIVYFALCLLSVAVIVSVWTLNAPRDMRISVEEKASVSPFIPAIENVSLTIHLDNEDRTCTIPSLDSAGIIRNIPAKYFGKTVRLEAQAKNCMSIDTTICLKKSINLVIPRNPSIYGHVSACLYDFDREVALPGVEVVVADTRLTTDQSGFFSLDVPIDRQMPSYTVKSDKACIIDSVIYMPCQESGAILNAVKKLH